MNEVETLQFLDIGVRFRLPDGEAIYTLAGIDGGRKFRPHIRVRTQEGPTLLLLSSAQVEVVV